MRGRIILSVVVLGAVIASLPLMPDALQTPFSACACLDENYALLNPFRDKAPEIAAQEAIAKAQICGQDLERHNGVSTDCLLAQFRDLNGWRGYTQVNRRAANEGVVLVFKGRRSHLLTVLMVDQRGHWILSGASLVG